MNTKHLHSHTLIAATLALSLVAAACAPSAKPTVKAPASATTAPKIATTVAKPTVAPPKATTAPTIAPKPTLAPSATPKAELTPAALGLGQQIGNLKITPSTKDVMPAVGTDRPKTGDVFLSFNVTIENVSKTESVVFDPLKVMVTGPGGVNTYPLTIIKGAKDELSGQTLKPGASASGVLIFEVPEKHSGFELMFENETNHVSWTVGA